MSGDTASVTAARIDTATLTAASGGEPIETMVPIAIPDAIAIGAAAIGVTNTSSETVHPNQIHASAVAAREQHSARITLCGARFNRWRSASRPAAAASSANTSVAGINGLSS